MQKISSKRLPGASGSQNVAGYIRNAALVRVAPSLKTKTKPKGRQVVVIVFLI